MNIRPSRWLGLAATLGVAAWFIAVRESYVAAIPEFCHSFIRCADCGEHARSALLARQGMAAGPSGTFAGLVALLQPGPGVLERIFRLNGLFLVLAALGAGAVAWMATDAPFTRWVAATSAAIVAMWSTSYASLQFWIRPDALTTFLLVVCAGAALAFAQKPTWRRAAGWGLVLGVTACTREYGFVLVVAAVLAIGLIGPEAPWTRVGRACACIGAFIGAGTLPIVGYFYLSPWGVSMLHKAMLPLRDSLSVATGFGLDAQSNLSDFRQIHGANGEDSELSSQMIFRAAAENSQDIVLLGTVAAASILLLLFKPQTRAIGLALGSCLTPVAAGFLVPTRTHHFTVLIPLLSAISIASMVTVLHAKTARRSLRWQATAIGSLLLVGTVQLRRSAEDYLPELNQRFERLYSECSSPTAGRQLVTFLDTQTDPDLPVAAENEFLVALLVSGRRWIKPCGPDLSHKGEQLWVLPSGPFADDLDLLTTLAAGVQVVSLSEIAARSRGCGVESNP
jgi:hypothetical protein